MVLPRKRLEKFKAKIRKVKEVTRETMAVKNVLRGMVAKGAPREMMKKRLNLLKNRKVKKVPRETMAVKDALREMDKKLLNKMLLTLLA